MNSTNSIYPRGHIDKNSGVSVLILTRNESVHIKRCIQSAQRVTPHVFVVDSNSSDGTSAIARAMNVEVISDNFENFSSKFNWALENIDFPTPWVIRLDADEVFSEDLIVNLVRVVSESRPEVSGIYLRRQIWFMGRWIKHGGMYPTHTMRLWRTGTVACEVRDLDEHMVLFSGEAVHIDLDIIDNPLISLDKWIEKHNSYASLEVLSVEKTNSSAADLIQAKLLGSQAARKRWLKMHLFYRLPLFIRPFLYFFFRYVILLGFLDGRIGFIFHFMHGLWYRLLVDAKIFEKYLSRRLF